ncbi:MAG: DNA-binding protein [Bacteroidales bacterium]|nr:DNA-binding protein [Bacteroidales bacterium]MBN2699426.1 DNA-binding protein [Bacteroidales bacterium]
MAQKKAFVLRVDPKLMKELEKWAADEFRSVNGQIEWILNRALRDSGRLGTEGTDHN